MGRYILSCVLPCSQTPGSVEPKDQIGLILSYHCSWRSSCLHHPSPRFRYTPTHPVPVPALEKLLLLQKQWRNNLKTYQDHIFKCWAGIRWHLFISYHVLSIKSLMSSSFFSRPASTTPGFWLRAMKVNLESIRCGLVDVWPKRTKRPVPRFGPQLVALKRPYDSPGIQVSHAKRMPVIRPLAAGRHLKALLGSRRDASGSTRKIVTPCFRLKAKLFLEWGNR